jgi:antitoxin component YwqK of YwqJK toxin-antitoxin module
MLHHMKYLFSFVIVFISIQGWTQSYSTVNYLDSQFRVVEKKKEASFERNLTHLGDSLYLAVIQDNQGNFKSEGAYVFTNDRFVENGEFIFYHLNGQIESRGYYSLGVKTGEWERYMSNGAPKASRYYAPESADPIRQAMKN